MLTPDLRFRIPIDGVIIMIKPKWLALILAGVKTLEIRPVPCRQYIGRTIYLCESGSKQVHATARLADVSDELSEQAWISLRAAHQVPGNRMYKKTYAWSLADVKPCDPFIPIARKQGSVGIQIGP